MEKIQSIFVFAVVHILLSPPIHIMEKVQLYRLMYTYTGVVLFITYFRVIVPSRGLEHYSKRTLFRFLSWRLGTVGEFTELNGDTGCLRSL